MMRGRSGGSDQAALAITISMPTGSGPSFRQE